jgi:hypothetical protein
VSLFLAETQPLHRVPRRYLPDNQAQSAFYHHRLQTHCNASRRAADLKHIMRNDIPLTKKLTRFDLQKMKQEGKRAVWMIAYDYMTAKIAEEAGLDMLLVGDSLGMVAYGYTGTVPVTMDQCIYHTEAVRRSAPNTLLELKYDGIRIPIKGGS